MKPDLINMKLTRKEAKQEVGMPPDLPSYPWGLSLNLDEEALDKLGETTMPAIGAELTLHATVKVTSVQASESNSGKARNVGLQITAMCLEAEGATTDHAKVLFGGATK